MVHTARGEGGTEVETGAGPARACGETDSGDRWLRRVAGGCGVAVAVVFVVGQAAAGASWAGYSHRAQLISELGGVAAPYPAIQNAMFFVMGVCIVAFAAGLDRAIGDRPSTVLFGAFGVLVAMHPVFPCDPGCEPVTLTGTLHNLVALVAFLAFIVGVVVVSRPMRRRPDWRRLGTASAVTGPVALLALAFWLVGGPALGLAGEAGSLQRGFVAIVLLWLAVVGAHLYRRADA